MDDNQRSDEKIPAGRIMQQDPPAGSRARRQRTVRVWVSAGARAIVVPRSLVRLKGPRASGWIRTVSRSHRPPRSARPTILPTPWSRRTRRGQSRAGRVSPLINRGEEATTYVMPDVIGTEGSAPPVLFAERLPRHHHRIPALSGCAA